MGPEEKENLASNSRFTSTALHPGKWWSLSDSFCILRKAYPFIFIIQMELIFWIFTLNSKAHFEVKTHLNYQKPFK